jgi:hypothetical protein
MNSNYFNPSHDNLCLYLYDDSNNDGAHNNVLHPTSAIILSHLILIYIASYGTLFPVRDLYKIYSGIAQR